MDTKTKRTSKRVKNTTFYLGKEERERRIAQLDALAARFADGKRSVLLQKIADGELIIQEPQAS